MKNVKNHAAVERAQRLGYPTSDFSEIELHDLWLELKASKPAVYAAVIFPIVKDYEDDEGPIWFSAVTTFLMERVNKDSRNGRLYYINITTDMWCFVDLYKETHVWGGD